MRRVYSRVGVKNGSVFSDHLTVDLFDGGSVLLVDGLGDLVYLYLLNLFLVSEHHPLSDAHDV